jgi:hypothetical protein
MYCEAVVNKNLLLRRMEEGVILFYSHLADASGAHQWKTFELRADR